MISRFYLLPPPNAVWAHISLSRLCLVDGLFVSHRMASALVACIVSLTCCGVKCSPDITVQKRFGQPTQTKWFKDMHASSFCLDKLLKSSISIGAWTGQFLYRAISPPELQAFLTSEDAKMMTHLGYDKEQLEVAILSEMLFTILQKLKMDHHHTVGEKQQPLLLLALTTCKSQAERLEQELSTLNDFLPLLDAIAQNQIEHHIEFFVIEDLVRIICRANRRTAIDEILSSSKFFRYILDLHRDRYYEQFDSSTRLLLWVNSNKLFCREVQYKLCLVLTAIKWLSSFQFIHVRSWS